MNKNQIERLQQMLNDKIEQKMDIEEKKLPAEQKKPSEKDLLLIAFNDPKFIPTFKKQLLAGTLGKSRYDDTVNLDRDTIIKISPLAAETNAKIDEYNATVLDTLQSIRDALRIKAKKIMDKAILMGCSEDILKAIEAF